jgi:hypothetical protein
MRRDGLNRFEGKDEPGARAAIGAIASGDVHDRRLAVRDETRHGPAFIANADDIARADGVRHASRRCRPRSGAKQPQNGRKAPTDRGICDMRGANGMKKLGTKPGDGGAEMALRGIPELDDERVILERLLDDAALDAFAAPVNQPYLAQPGLMRGAHVLLDHGLDVARGEGMEIESVFDRYVPGHGAV